MYKNILFAVEFTHAEYLAELQIKQLVELFKAQLFLINVIEMPTIDILPDIINKEILYLDQARKELANIGKMLNVTTENQLVEIGYPKIIIPKIIEQYNIDLLIVGHHERKGMYHLLGSTVYALLAHAKCAVLTLPYPAF
ncbi:MAG: universal stress protein [Gammaproteobacteria bacterium]